MTLLQLSRPEAARELLARRRARASLEGFIEVAAEGIVPARHHKKLIEKLEAVERGEIPRLMIFMPPGSAKSTYASILFPPWYMGRNPEKLVIAASHTAELSERFGRRVRNIVADDPFRRIFGFGLSGDSTAAGRWETQRGGEYYAVGVGGSVTGRRADLGIIDDPVKGRADADSETTRDKIREWYKADFWTRLKPGAAVILIMTRWHEDDLAGWLLDEQGRGGEPWDVLSLPAIAEAHDPLGRAPGETLWPEWFSPEILTEAKRDPRNWSALYQQRPTPESGDYFKREWLRWYETRPDLATLRTYGASDYAVTADGGDFTVHGIIGVDPDDNIFVLDWWRQQAASDAWVEAALDLMERWKPLMWGEEQGQIIKGVGPFISRRQRERRIYGYRRQYTSSRDKPTRAQAIRARMAMGKVYLPTGAPWTTDLVNELLSFPAGKNDDQVDALSLFGRMLDSLVGGNKPVSTEPIRGIADMTLDEVWKHARPRTPGRPERI